MLKPNIKLFHQPFVSRPMRSREKYKIFLFSQSKDGEKRKEDAYEKICREERERMNRLGEESREKYKKQTTFTRATFLVFAGVINIYLLKKFYSFLVYKNDPYSKKG